MTSPEHYKQAESLIQRVSGTRPQGDIEPLFVIPMPPVEIRYQNPWFCRPAHGSS